MSNQNYDITDYEKNIENKQGLSKNLTTKMLGKIDGIYRDY